MIATLQSPSTVLSLKRNNVNMLRDEIRSYFMHLGYQWKGLIFSATSIPKTSKHPEKNYSPKHPPPPSSPEINSESQVTYL